jgi:DNA-binding MarR family transcriptional regulator
MLAERMLANAGTADIGELNDIVGFHIRLAHGAVYRHFTDSFSHLGLTQKQVSVLWLVHDHPGIAQIELGSRLQMDRATTMTIVNRLQERDYLRREKSETDGRKQALYLTPDGQTALAEARECIRQDEDWLKQRFTDNELRLLVDLLRRIHE